MVASLERKARAISSVVSPPIRRSVSAARASVDNTGWQAMKMRLEKLIADIVVHGRFEVLDPGIARTLEVAADLLVLAREHAAAADGCRWRGAWPRPSARRRDCPGRRIRGHSDSAITQASCASSSAKPTSRTIRARPAMSLARSIRKTVSIA